MVREELEKRGESAEDKWLISIAEPAHLPGVSKSKVWVMVHSGQIPSLAFGRSRRIPLKEFRAWLDMQVAAANKKD